MGSQTKKAKSNTVKPKEKKRKSPMYVVVDKANGHTIFGAFELTANGLALAEQHAKKLQKTSASKLFVESR